MFLHLGELFPVHGIRCGRGRVRPDGGTSGSVCDVHSVTEQLSYQLRIRCLATSAAGAGELKQRLLELAALYSIFFEFLDQVCLLRQLACVVEAFLLHCSIVACGSHNQKMCIRDRRLTRFYAMLL